MGLVSFVYNRLLRAYARAGGRKRLAMRAVAEAFIEIVNTFSDPEVTVTVRDRRLLLPLSHRLPLYVIADRSYGELPGRLSSFLR